MINDAEAKQQLKFRFTKDIKDFGQVQIDVRYYQSDMGPTIGYTPNFDGCQQEYNLPVDFFKQILQYLISKNLTQVKGLKKQPENKLSGLPQLSIAPLPSLNIRPQHPQQYPPQYAQQYPPHYQPQQYPPNIQNQYQQQMHNLQAQTGQPIPIAAYQQQFQLSAPLNAFTAPPMKPVAVAIPQQRIIQQAAVLQDKQDVDQPDYKLERLKANAKREERAKSISQGLSKVKRKQK